MPPSTHSCDKGLDVFVTYTPKIVLKRRFLLGIETKRTEQKEQKQTEQWKGRKSNILREFLVMATVVCVSLLANTPVTKPHTRLWITARNVTWQPTQLTDSRSLLRWETSVNRQKCTFQRLSGVTRRNSVLLSSSQTSVRTIPPVTTCWVLLRSVIQMIELTGSTVVEERRTNLVFFLSFLFFISLTKYKWFFYSLKLSRTILRD